MLAELEEVVYSLNRRIGALGKQQSFVTALDSGGRGEIACMYVMCAFGVISMLTSYVALSTVCTSALYISKYICLYVHTYVRTSVCGKWCPSVVV